MQQPVDYRKTHQWEHGLCGCFDNMTVCCLAWCCPCVAFGQTAEALGKSCCCYGCLYLCWPMNLCLESHQRKHIRDIRGIPGNCFTDCCLVCWCPVCALSQEMQEVELLQSQERAREAMGPTQLVGGNIRVDHQGNTVVVDALGNTLAITTAPRPWTNQPQLHNPAAGIAGPPVHMHDVNTELQPQSPVDMTPPPYSAYDSVLKAHGIDL